MPPRQSSAPASSAKPIHTVVLDAGPLVRNEPAISSLLARSDVLVTTPAVLAEIRDPGARSRIEATVLPFLTLRNASSASLNTVTEFARRTGDLPVLSRPDLLILALAYELECERNGGDWRLRKVPGQKGLNGAPPTHSGSASSGGGDTVDASGSPPLLDEGHGTAINHEEQLGDLAGAAIPESNQAGHPTLSQEPQTTSPDLSSSPNAQDPTVTGQEPGTPNPNSSQENIPESIRASRQEANRLISDEPEVARESAESEDSDSEGWITPSNIHKHRMLASDGSILPANEPKTMQVATITTDFAMQNVLLQMNLNLLSPAMQRVRHLKTWVLRCHGCFKISKDMTKQFCPSCGGPTLTRTACSTDQNGVFKIHLKKNYQWNNRGNVFSIPKAVSGSASGKPNVGGGGKGGGKGGWGQDLILREDQKEYVRAIQREKREKERDPMDEDYLPNILTGERGRMGSRPGVGAGRNVNSKKRH